MIAIGGLPHNLNLAPRDAVYFCCSHGIVPSRSGQMMPHPSRDHPAAAGLQQRDRQSGTQAALGNYEFVFIRVHSWLQQEPRR